MGSYVSRQAFLPPHLHPIEHQNNIIWLQTRSSHKIPALFVKPPLLSPDLNPLQDTERFTILFSHGNAEDLGSIEDWVFELAFQLKVNVFAYDYSGYGFSTTIKDQHVEEATEQYCYEDIEASYQFLRQQQIPPERIIVMGRSLGTGPTTHLASKFQVGGVILQSPLLSAVRVVVHVPFTLPIDIFANLDKIHKIKAPVFIIHGTADEVISVEHGRELYRRLPSSIAYPPWIIEGAEHNNIEFSFFESFLMKLREFLNELEKQQSNGKYYSERSILQYSQIDN